MGKRISSLLNAAEAAGYAMAPEDIYAVEETFVQHVMAPASPSTALVPYVAATPSLGLLGHAKALASRYTSGAFLGTRLPA